MRMLCVLGAVLALQAVSLAGSNNTVISAPPMKSSPIIDGVINEKEWKEAVKISGGGWKGVQDARQFSLWMGYDEANLYFAVRSELPPGGKLLTKASEGKDVANDDSVEIIVQPPEDRNPGPFQFGFFQMILNSEGVVWGIHHEPGWGLSNLEWKPNVAQKHSLTPDGFWDFELAIPLSDMGVDKMKLPSDWKFLVARNFKFPNVQAAITPSDNFIDKSKMAVLQCEKEVPVVQVSYPDWKNLVARKAEISLFNPSDSTRKVSVKAGYIPGNFTENQKEIVIKAGETRKLMVESNAGKNEQYELKVQIDQSGKPLFDRDSVFVPKEGKLWTNLAASLKFQQGFQEELEKADFSAVDQPEALIFGEARIQTSEDGKTKYLFIPNDASVVYNKSNLAVPGAIFCKVRPNVPLIKNEARIYWKTEKKDKGFLFLHENEKNISFGMQYFPWNHENNSQVIVWKKPAGGISGWMNIVVNLQKDSASMFVNGVLAGRMEFEGPLTDEMLGHLSLGASGDRFANSFDVADLSIYDRSLADDEAAMMGYGEGRMLGRVRYFPSLHQLVLEAVINPQELPKDSVLSFVVNSVASGETVVTSGLDIDPDVDKDVTRMSSGNISIIKRIELPQLEDGEYVAFLKVGSKTDEANNGTFLSRTFLAKSYPWENNTIGLSRIIVPPFTPLKVNGNEISCLLRRYVIGKSGFPEKITAKGDEVLASPVTCVVVSGGKEHPWTSSGVDFSEKSDDLVRYSCDSENDLLKLNVTGEMEYDGLLKLTLKLVPKNHTDKVDRIFIDIPVRKELAKLFHAVGMGNRANPSGYLPKGDGVIWKSRSIRNNQYNFLPYLWVGEEEKGVCYAADWDKDWVHSSDLDAVQLIRAENGDVSIRLNLIDGAILTREREIVLSIMGTPIKPKPEGWRGWSVDYSSFGTPGNKFFQCLWAAPYWGNFYGESGRYPAFQDFEVIRKLNETRKTGVIDEDFLKKFVEKIENAPRKDVPDIYPVSSKPKGYVEIYLRAGFNAMKGLSKQDPEKTLAYYYTCGFENFEDLPEYEVYQDEWNSKGKGHLVKSYSDYAIYYAAKMVEAGMGGIYLDNLALVYNDIWPTGDGYIDDEGHVKPSYGLWRKRDFIHRLAVMFMEMGKDPFIEMHDTNAVILPAFSFGTSTVDLEWHYDDTEFQDRYPADYLRASVMGGQGGFFSSSIDGIVAPPEKRPWLTRTMMACLLPHEIAPTIWIKAGTDMPTYRKLAGIVWDFGKAAADTQFIPYWDENSPVKPLRGDLLASTYVRGDKMLLVIGNYGDGGDIPIKIDAHKLGFSGIVNAVNSENNQSISIQGNDSIVLPIKKHDVALIELTLKQ